MPTYAIHRMNSYADILAVMERLGKEKFREIRNQIYRDLMYLDVSKFYPLDAAWPDVDVETKVRICCLFLSEDLKDEYAMSNDYTKIIHKHKFEQNANSINYFSPDAIRFRSGGVYNRALYTVQPAKAANSNP